MTVQPARHGQAFSFFYDYNKTRVVDKLLEIGVSRLYLIDFLLFTGLLT